MLTRGYLGYLTTVNNRYWCPKDVYRSKGNSRTFDLYLKGQSKLKEKVLVEIDISVYIDTFPCLQLYLLSFFPQSGRADGVTGKVCLRGPDERVDGRKREGQR